MTMQEAWEEVKADKRIIIPPNAKPVYYWEPGPETPMSTDVAGMRPEMARAVEAMPAAFIICANEVSYGQTFILAKWPRGWDYCPGPVHLIRRLVNLVNALAGDAGDMIREGEKA